MMRKLRECLKKCPLVACIVLSWAILACVEYAPRLANVITEAQNQAAQKDRDNLTADDKEGKDLLEWIDGETQEITQNDTLSGIIAANRAPDLSEQVLMGNGEPDRGEALEDEAPQEEENVSGEAAQPEEEPLSDAGETTKDTQNAGEQESDKTEASEKPKKIKPKYITYEKKQTDSPWYTDPGKIPQTTEYDYQKVKANYFDDAVFIGDSRMVGMNDYSGLTNATFFAKTGLTVYNLLDDKFVKDPDSGKMVSVSDMMQRHTYGKIYLMVGINELGTGGTQRFQEAYQEVLKKFRKWQPDAMIYVQSIMGVSPRKDKTDRVFNNTNIRDKNYAISKLTDGIHIFYLNIQEIYEDENHNLAQELTFDDVHLYAQHYDRWVKYLKTHAVVK